MSNNNYLLFPQLPGQAFPITRSPKWKTRYELTLAGKQTALPDWNYPHYMWKLVHNVLRQGGVSESTYAEMQTLFNFFNKCAGMGNVFLYQDQDDYQTTNQLLGVTDGRSAVYPMLRSFGGFVERVVAPSFEVTPTLFVAGVQQAPGTFTITPWGTTNVNGPGCVIFNTPPAANLTILMNFQYYWACRFSAEDCIFEEKYQGYFAVKTLSFESILL